MHLAHRTWIHPRIQELIRCRRCDHRRCLGDATPGARLAPGEVPDLWNIAHPEEAGAVAKAYVNAGSQIIVDKHFWRKPVSGCGEVGAERTKSKSSMKPARGFRAMRRAAMPWSLPPSVRAENC